jgi:hypothetical protein
MNIKTSLILVLVLVTAIPLSVSAKKKRPDTGMVENMEAVTCGAKQRGLSGLGSVWASVGVTRVNSDEKLCPQYLLRTDENEYEIRSTAKHPTLLPVGHEAEFKIKKDVIFLKVRDGDDRKTRSYQVVGIKPTNPDSGSQKSSSALSSQP